MTIVAISGGFDPLHGGHIDLIEEAAIHGKVVVILNSDEWLIRKKGYAFMDWTQRQKILRSMRDVDNVIPAIDTDGSVCETLLQLRPDYFANGGDRTEANTPELKLCADLGIRPLFGIGGTKSASSSNLVEISTIKVQASCRAAGKNYYTSAYLMRKDA
jgi:cytidyltransferase-like protein